MTKLIARIDTFTKQGRYVPRGGLMDREEVDDTESGNVIEAPDGINDAAVVEISAIAPTGPNPKNPQQVPPGAHSTEAGFVMDGARLIGEVTVPEKQRIEVVGIDPEDNTQGLISEALANAPDNDRQNHDDALVAGTVADVTAGITADTDDAELDRLEAAEKDREKPRSGVLNAIGAERDRRAAAEA